MQNTQRMLGTYDAKNAGRSRGTREIQSKFLVIAKHEDGRMRVLTSTCATRNTAGLSFEEEARTSSGPRSEDARWVSEEPIGLLAPALGRCASTRRVALAPLPIGWAEKRSGLVSWIDKGITKP